MKKVIFRVVAAIFALCCVSTASAEVFNGEKNTIGIRATNGVEVTYQRYLSDDNRIEATLGLGGYGFDATKIQNKYQLGIGEMQMSNTRVTLSCCLYKKAQLKLQLQILLC